MTFDTTKIKMQQYNYLVWLESTKRGAFPSVYSSLKKWLDAKLESYWCYNVVLSYDLNLYNFLIVHSTWHQKLQVCMIWKIPVRNCKRKEQSRSPSSDVECQRWYIGWYINIPTNIPPLAFNITWWWTWLLLPLAIPYRYFSNHANLKLLMSCWMHYKKIIQI